METGMNASQKTCISPQRQIPPMLAMTFYLMTHQHGKLLACHLRPRSNQLSMPHLGVTK
jgi:hypothetical protein